MPAVFFLREDKFLISSTAWLSFTNKDDTELEKIHRVHTGRVTVCNLCRSRKKIRNCLTRFICSHSVICSFRRQDRNWRLCCSTDRNSRHDGSMCSITRPIGDLQFSSEKLFFSRLSTAHFGRARNAVLFKNPDSASLNICAPRLNLISLCTFCKRSRVSIQVLGDIEIARSFSRLHIPVMSNWEIQAMKGLKTYLLVESLETVVAFFCGVEVPECIAVQCLLNIFDRMEFVVSEARSAVCNNLFFLLQ